MKREDLEKSAMEAVCACQHYDLADNIENMTDEELQDIIDGNYDCEMCGLRKRREVSKQ